MRHRMLKKQTITTALEIERLELEGIGHMMFPIKIW